MDFVEFAGLLYPIIGGGATTGKFARTFFQKITDFPASKIDDENPLIDEDDPAFKNYFNGNRKIRLIAKKINPYIEVTKFAAYINSFDDGRSSIYAAPLQRAVPESQHSMWATNWQNCSSRFF